MRIGDIDDTIAAISSPTGAGPRGIIRISGPHAFPIAAQLVDPNPTTLADRADLPVRVSGSLLLEDLRLPAIAYVFARPRSYTGQDVVELHVPGSPVLLEMVLESIIRRGARLAGPGEFTARAYLNGRMNLIEAEAVAAVVAAEGDDQLRAAQALLHGALTDLASAQQAQLADLLALIEAGIDFSEEDIEFIDPATACRRIQTVLAALKDLRKNSVDQERLDLLPRAILLGPTNAGKSTLMNRLSGIDRAICSPLPGTTRDVLSAPLRLAHGECLLLDAAGLTETPTDPIDAAATEAALRAATHADLLCLVLEPANLCDPGSACPASPDVVLLNKSDTLAPDVRDRLIQQQTDRWYRPALPISALRGHGIERLLTWLDDRLFGQGAAIRTGALALTARHRQAIDQAIDALGRAADLTQSGNAGELVAMEVREAIDQLAALAGQIATDDILNRIFSRFCIGK